jgi:hypothetical protein
MQVTQAVESENFAIVGGGDNRAFKIGASAQAFKTLSDTLYSNKPLAVVREVLCNAVDAHIVAGIADKPVEVKLTPQEMTITDFGPGIADDRMVDIYATYFGSTKQSDDSQTGGFGLGSKSPFAYTDHFTVTSCHAGQKRVYALHIGDEETDGAPAIKLMATVPCGDLTGVSVAVPIDNHRDFLSFDSYIQEVVRNGGMNATLNGNLLSTRDYTELRKVGFGLFNANTSTRPGVYTSRSYNVPVYILYGNVLYPMGDNPAIQKVSRELTEWAFSHFDLIVAVPPSSVTVTPSREALGYNKRTIATLNRIIGRAVHKLKTEYSKALRQALVETIEGKMTRANVAVKWKLAHGHEFTAKAQQEKAYVGAEAMALLRARHNVEGRSYEFEKFLDFASRYFGDKSKQLRSVVEPNHHGWTFNNASVPERMRMRLGNVDVLQEQHRYLTQKLLRFVPSELWRKLYYASGATPPVRITKYRHGHASSGEPALYIAHNRDAVLMAKKRGYYLIDNKITAEQIAAIEEAAPRFRVTVDVLEKIEPVKKEPKPKKDKTLQLYRPLRVDGKRHDGRSETVWGIAAPAIAQPSAYLAWAPSRYKSIGFGIPLNKIGHQLPERLEQRFPNTVFAIGLTEVKQLQDAGVPRVETLLLDQIEKRVALNSNDDGITLRFIERVDSWHYYHDDAVRLALTLMKVNRRLAFAVLGLPYTPLIGDPQPLWKLAIEVFEGKAAKLRRHNLANIDTAILDDDAKRFAELKAQALKNVDPEIAKLLDRVGSGKVTETDFPHLAFYGKVINRDLSDLTDDDKDRLAQMIEAEHARLHYTEPLDDNGDQL